MNFKIVLNKCYGGFSLSAQALNRLRDLGALPMLERHKEECDENYEYRQLLKLERTNPLLVQVVEELGEKANGECSDLVIRMITVDININSFDGYESVDVSAYYF
jgi:hypothetical protein